MNNSQNYDDFYRRSIFEPDTFWGEQSALVHWEKPPEQICNYSRPPFAGWFLGGITNLCYNAVDRHLSDRADQPALIYVSTETGIEKTYTFRELHAEVQFVAAALLELGVQQGDRVLLYMPMVPEAAFSMLACARIGAIHSVVFGGFASHALASRIEDATPKLIISADGGSRGGKVVAYKPLLDEAIGLSKHKPPSVLLIDRGLAPMDLIAGQDYSFETMRERFMGAVVPCVWLESSHPSYILYTSGTTGRPKGVQRDTGGYAVALAASMKYIFGAKAGETFFSTSDIGWVVGHSYIVYGPLIAGMATIMYEGLPIRPDAAIWWSLVEKHKVNLLFSAPTAIRVLRNHDAALLKRHDLSSLRTVFLAGEPLDEPTAAWVANSLRKPVIDNYWQTETGWPLLAICNGVEPAKSKLGSPGKAVYGYNLKILDEDSGIELTGPGQRGVLVIEGPLPPGCMQTIWQDDRRFISTYWKTVAKKMVYSTFDWAIRDPAGYYTILGRTDDVINVAGHRLGTREIEESIASHRCVAEVAVIGMADALKGQAAIAFVVLRDSGAESGADVRFELEGELLRTVERQLGSVARPAGVRFVSSLPKTRSGKIVRRAIQAICENRDPGDLTTIEEPAALDRIREVMVAKDSDRT